MEIAFGALSPPLCEQLPQPRQRRRSWLECCKTWQKDADAIVRLKVHQHLSEAECHRARKRLLRTIDYFYRKNGF